MEDLTRRIMRPLERLLFGYTAEESVELQMRFAEMLAERKLEQALGRLVESEQTQGDQVDRQ